MATQFFRAGEPSWIFPGDAISIARSPILSAPVSLVKIKNPAQSAASGNLGSLVFLREYVGTRNSKQGFHSIQFGNTGNVSLFHPNFHESDDDDFHVDLIP